MDRFPATDRPAPPPQEATEQDARCRATLCPKAPREAALGPDAPRRAPHGPTTPHRPTSLAQGLPQEGCHPEALRQEVRRREAPDWEAFKACLRRQALRLGLATVGFVAARPLTALRLELQRRLAEGSYPAFCERDADLRSDPQRWLPGARSLWVAAWPYQPPLPREPLPPRSTLPPGTLPPANPPPGHHPPPQRPFGRMAAYAVCPDYHVGLRRRLEVLVRWAARRTGCDPDRDFRILVDTGPPVEREPLRLSGAGFIGKNTCAFVPGAGSWVLLGVVASTLPVPPDPSAADPDAPFAPADACAGCTRCIDACPTGALSPYRLDPTRCISQLTQLRGSLDETQRLALGSWVFGCDVCQLVCPYNGPEQAPLAYAGAGRLRPAPGLSTRIGLLELLAMDTPAFDARLGATAAAWRGKNVLQRNAAYAAARALARSAAGGDPRRPRPAEALPAKVQPPADPLPAALQQLAESHPSPRVREACAWALNRPRSSRPRRLRPCRTRPSAAPSPPGAASPDR